MRSNSDSWIAIGAALFVILGLAWALYRPKVQQSVRYQATVVPLANIMDVGFIVLSPAIVLLAGFAAPLVMLGICLVAIATGFAISYNIRNQEPIEGTKDSVNKIARFSQWALLAASVVNISYYTLLLITLVLWPLGAYSDGAVAVWGTIYLAGIGLIGWFGASNGSTERRTRRQRSISRLLLAWWRPSSSTTSRNGWVGAGNSGAPRFRSRPKTSARSSGCSRWSRGSRPPATSETVSARNSASRRCGWPNTRATACVTSVRRKRAIVGIRMMFAFYFLLQALIAGMLAWRKQAWGAMAGFTAIGLAMATISVFGISI